MPDGANDRGTRAQRPSFVSVLVPARNEAANIGDCVWSLLKQGEGVEIIVADDASEDGTAGIVEEIARDAACRSSPGNPGVKLIRVPPLPPGWLGKNHALYVAAQHAQGEWLLFTDADTRHVQGALRSVVDRAEKEGLDFVSYSPPQEAVKWWEKAVIPLVYQLLGKLFPFARVNDPADSLAAANGQFLLIRRKVYSRIGGHQAVCSEVLEDVELATRAKQAGVRIWFGAGDGIVSTRMYREFSAMWEGWTKNLFLLFRRSGQSLFRAASDLALRYLLPVLAGVVLLAVGFPAAWFGAAVLVCLAFEHRRYARALPRKSVAEAALLVPGAAILFLLLVNSYRRYSRNKGILWKGRLYPAK